MITKAVSPRFEGNFTIHTRHLSPQQRNDVISLAVTENLSFRIAGNSQDQDAFIMIHTPNPPGVPTQQFTDKNSMVFSQLAKMVVPFVFTPEPLPRFHQDIKDALANGDDLSSVNITEFDDRHDIMSHYVQAARNAIRGFAWKPVKP